MKPFNLRNKSFSAWLLIVQTPIAFLFSILLFLFSLLDPRSWQFNKSEAVELLKQHLEGFRVMTTEQIRIYLADETNSCTVIIGDSGQEYQIEVEGIQTKEGFRLIGSIDDGRLRAFFPLTQEIIICCAHQI